MALSVFADKSHRPTDDDLRSALGKAHPAWARLIERVTARLPPISEVWGFTSAGTGWGLRLRRKDRVILYVTPRQSREVPPLAVLAQIKNDHQAK